ncbi:MAG: glycerophosphoryl diester phosphodiesterase [Sneathiella sp.]|nr:glycerophosphoryl diester phosphodiesterase [Sneathiella sp.]
MTAPFFETMPRIIGHRGAKGLAPENTLASFKVAANAGAKSIEIDVTVTRDNNAIIHHDSNVTRCTNGQGPILLKSLEQVRALDAGSWFSAQYTGEKIPTLSEALLSVKQLGMSLNLEVKPTKGWQVPTAELVGRQLQKELQEDFPILLSSFSIEALATIGKIVPNVPLGYLTEAIPPDWEKRMQDAGAASFHCQGEFVTKDIVLAVQKAGFKFLVYTVNDPEYAKQLLNWNVDAIITDYPDILLPLCEG